MARHEKHVWRSRDQQAPPLPQVLAVLTARDAGVVDLQPVGNQVEVVAIGRDKCLRYRLRPEDVAARYGPPVRRRRGGHG